MRHRRGALGLGVLFAAGAAVAVVTGQSPTFSSRVDLVRVDVLVTARGKPVRDLRPQDFEVRDNGVLQRPDFAAFERLPLNVVLTLDVSGSVEGDRLAHLLEAGRALLDGLQPVDRAALIAFSHRIQIGCPPTLDRALMRRALDATIAGGDTALVDASLTGMIMAESGEGRALELVFSDGVDTSSWLPPSRVLDIAKASDVVAYAVWLGGREKPRFLEDLSDTTGGRVIRLERTRDLPATFVQILEEFRERYVLGYTPRGVARDGWHALDVRVKRAGLDVRARPGYMAR